MTLPGDGRWAVFASMGEFESWEASVSESLGVSKYSTGILRQEPADGTVVAKYRISQNVWSGPNMSEEDLRPMGYYQIFVDPDFPERP